MKLFKRYTPKEGDDPLGKCFMDYENKIVNRLYHFFYELFRYRHYNRTMVIRMMMAEWEEKQKYRKERALEELKKREVR